MRVIKLGREPTQMWTKNAVHPRGFNRFWEKWSADKWLILSLTTLVLGLLLLAAWNIYDVILRIV